MKKTRGSNQHMSRVPFSAAFNAKLHLHPKAKMVWHQGRAHFVVPTEAVTKALGAPQLQWEIDSNGRYTAPGGSVSGGGDIASGAGGGDMGGGGL